MSFSPTGKIYLLANVNLDPQYNFVQDFATSEAQYNFFYSKIAKIIDSTTFVRRDMTIKAPFHYDSLYGVNYVMYKNSTTGKWVYCFINEKVYMNEGMTILSIETDVYQTFMFDYEILPSFVEREHIEGDDIGANLIPENLETGEYIINSSTDTGVMDSFGMLVLTTVDTDGGGMSSCNLTKLYSGAGALYFSQPPFLSTFLNKVDGLGKSDGVVSITALPKFLFLEQIEGGYVDQITPASVTRNINAINTLNGYTPKNKKLLTYPYSFLLVSNNSGNHAELKREFLDDKSMFSFMITGNLGANCSVACVPKGYKGEVNNFNEMLTISNFPQIAWKTDTFRNWVAQNSNATITGLLTSGLSVAMGVATGNPMATAGGLIGASQSIGAMLDRSKIPPQTKGNTNGSGLNVALGIQDFNFYNMSITQEQAKVIDDYFTMYGYKTNRVKVPNLRTRPIFNYVKTIGVNISGNLDTKDMEKLKTIYDKGVTIWHGTSRSYSSDNS